MLVVGKVHFHGAPTFVNGVWKASKAFILMVYIRVARASPNDQASWLLMFQQISPYKISRAMKIHCTVKYRIVRDSLDDGTAIASTHQCSVPRKTPFVSVQIPVARVPDKTHHRNQHPSHPAWINPLHFWQGISFIDYRSRMQLQRTPNRDLPYRKSKHPQPKLFADPLRS